MDLPVFEEGKMYKIKDKKTKQVISGEFIREANNAAVVFAGYFIVKGEEKVFDSDHFTFSAIKTPKPKTKIPKINKSNTRKTKTPKTQNKPTTPPRRSSRIASQKPTTQKKRK